MAKATTKEPQIAEQDEFLLPIEEFCASLSKDDRRVELIGAFHSHEKLAGNLKNTRTSFQAHYDAFINAPA